MKFLKTNIARIVIGILWGLGLACIFRKTCEGNKCIVYKAANPNTITKNVYRYNDKCYSYTTTNTKCTDNAIPN